MKTQFLKSSQPAVQGVRGTSPTLFGVVRQFMKPTLALAVLAALASTAQAQSVKFRSGMLRVTVPVNSSLSSTLTNAALLSGINGSGAALSISGLPSGATASVSPSVALTNNTPLTITVNTTNVAQGTYTFSLNGVATDTNSVVQTNNYFLTLDVAYIYNGGTNVVVDGARTFSAGSAWLGGVAPGTGDSVVFGDLGTQTNSLINTGTTNFTPNILVNSSVNLDSIRFNSTNSAIKFTTIGLGNGVTLGVFGSNGLSMLRDFNDNFQGLTGGQTVAFSGTNSTLLVSNSQARVTTLIDNGLAHLMDMSRLDTFVAKVSQVAVGDYLYYPNFFNIDANNTSATGTPGGVPRQFLSSWNLARTNIITSSFVDPFNYTNADSRQFGFSFMNSELSGSGTAPIINFGITNYVSVDAVNFVGGNSRGNVQFNPALLVTTNIVGAATNLVTNNMTAVFRGTNGGRMTLFSVSDGAGTNFHSSNIKSTVDFSTASGTVDILANNFFVGRDRRLIITNSGSSVNYQGFFTMGKGIVDVNTAVLGYRQYTQTNTNGAYGGYCEGRFTVQSNGTFRVNTSLTLGSTVESNVNAIGSGGNTEYGQLLVLNSGSANVNRINVGGPVYGVSTNNNITVSNNATLTVTNNIGSTNQSLDNLLIYSGSVLALTVDTTNLGPYVFTSTLGITGSNQIQISAVKHLASYTSPIALIQYKTTGSSGSFQSQKFPAGINGAITLATNGNIVTMNLTILTNIPKSIVWRGYANANWDLSSINWQDLSNGNHTNFANGDSVLFDDTAVPTTITLNDPSDLIPGSITMTNSVNYYTFADGGGNVVGSAPFAKTGTNGLQVDAQTSFGLTVSQGYLVGAGSISSASIAAGTTMNYSGGVANGLSVGGVANFSGVGSGTISVLNGGIVTNAGEWDGNISCVSNSIIYNTGNIGTDSTYNQVGALVLGSGAWLVNSGNIHARTFTVNGTLQDNGTGVIYIFGDTANGTQGVTIGTGGNFIPGGGTSTGVTTITTQFPTSFTNAGRLLLSQGSTNLFVVNNSVPNNAMVQARVMGWGPNQGSPNYNGATLVISNISATPFFVGQVLQLALSDINGTTLGDAGLNTTNAYPIIVPSVPGPGLAWDLTSIIHAGQLKVIGVNTNSTNIVFAPSYTQIINTNGAGSTNNAIVSHLSWPADHIGWRLQTQANDLSVGVSTNWTTVPNSTFTNDMTFTNQLSTNGNQLQVYRMIFP